MNPQRKKIAETCHRHSLNFNSHVEYKEFIKDLADIFEEENRRKLKEEFPLMSHNNFEAGIKRDKSQFLKTAGCEG